MTDHANSLAEQYVNQGLLLAGQGRLNEAAESFRQALQWQPGCAAAHNNLGTILLNQGHAQEAMACYYEALRCDAQHAGAYYNLGVIFQGQGDFASAVTCYEQSLRLNPHQADAYSNLASVFTGQNRAAEAIGLYQQAIRLQPQSPELHFNLASTFSEQGQLDDAVVHYREAVRLQPTFARAHRALGNALAAQGHLDDAAASFGEALRLMPDHEQTHFELAKIMMLHGDFDTASTHYVQAIRVEPHNAEFHYNFSHLLLLQGNFAHGWPEYEWRWQLPAAKRRVFSAPWWDGAALEGRTILLHSEQGLGDTIQCLRYASLVAQRGGTVLVECQPSLISLAATCAGIHTLIAAGELLPPFDVQAPLLSLPRILGTALSNIPANIPYLTADAERAEQWRRELAAEHRLKVGVVWQGNPQHPRDHDRSVALKEFAPLAEVEGVALFSLQVGTGREQLSQAGLPVVDLGGRFDLTSLTDLAAVLVHLDLVVSVDTAAVHLAGALGVPVWVALPKLPDWRWMLDRSDSPWYPSMRLFRQERSGEWNIVLEQIAHAMRTAVQNPRNSKPS